MDNHGKESLPNSPKQDAISGDVHFQTPAKSKSFLFAVTGFVAVIAILGVIFIVLQKNDKVSPQSSNTFFVGNKQKKQFLDLKVVNEGEIVLSSNGYLYIFNTGTMEKSLLPISDLKASDGKATDGSNYASGLSFTHNGRYFFFNYKRKFYIFDFKTNKYTTLDINPNPFAGSEDISPDDKYAVLETRTGPGNGGKYLIDIEKGKVLYETEGGLVKWASDSSKFVFNKEEIDWWNLGFLGPSPENSSVYLIDVSKTKIGEELFLKATEKRSFGVNYWLDNSNIIFGEYEFEEPIPSYDTSIDVNDQKYKEHWLSIWQNPKASFWKTNIFTAVKEQTVKPAKKMIDRTSYSPSGEWKVVVEGEWPNKAVYIIKVDGSNKIKIGDGDEALWRPTAKY